MKAVRVIVVVVLIVAGLSAAGYFAYSRLSAGPQSDTALTGAVATTAPAVAPVGPPGPVSSEVVSSKVLIGAPVPRAKRQDAWYIHDPKIPGGALKGLCYVASDKAVRLYPPLPIEVAAAINDPAEGEQGYFDARKPVPMVYLSRYARNEKRYGVKGAVVMIHEVSAGPRPEFDRLRFQVDFRNQQIVPAKPEGEDVFNPSNYDVGVMMVKQLIGVLNLTLHDCPLTLTDTETGQVVWQEAAPKYRDPEFPGDHLGDNPEMARPTVLQIPRIDKRGVYRLSCRRHPWHVAYLVLWDSPYVDVSADDPDDLHRSPERAGAFHLTGIPEGSYTVEVWHPQLAPVKKTHQVEIAMDRTTPLMIEFQPPAMLEATPPDLPEAPITDWAFVGPFYLLMDEEPDAPNNSLSFTATYEGMEEDVAWKAIQADAPAGYVHLDKIMWRMDEPCLSYYAVAIDSPKAQKLLLQINNDNEAVKVWLNGKNIFRPCTGDFGRYRRFADGLLVSGELKTGENILLMMVTANRTREARFSVRYRAEGVALRVPLKK